MKQKNLIAPIANGIVKSYNENFWFDYKYCMYLTRPLAMILMYKHYFKPKDGKNLCANLNSSRYGRGIYVLNIIFQEKKNKRPKQRIAQISRPNKPYYYDTRIQRKTYSIFVWFVAPRPFPFRLHIWV